MKKHITIIIIFILGKRSFSPTIVLGKKAGSLASASGWMVEMASASTQNLYISDGTNQVSTSRTLTGYTDGDWHFITYVINRSNNTETVYMDAVARGATIDISSVTGTAGTGASMLIGTKGNLGQYYSGTLDDVRIYNRALSAAEITTLYNLGRTKLK